MNNRRDVVMDDVKEYDVWMISRKNMEITMVMRRRRSGSFRFIIVAFLVSFLFILIASYFSLSSAALTTTHDILLRIFVMPVGDGGKR
mmetsp:Transcript_5732/g.7177  ORF Transcript_5732/g.7177 Transcript_5732/m.7177 type:complete len:88 (-) Transcript_5732:55-318(-)